MFLHLSVSHSVHRGRGSALVHAGIRPPPWDQTPLGPGTPLSSRHPPGTRHTPGPGTPRHQVPPRQQTATVADGTHPTGMHSCLNLKVILS